MADEMQTTRFRFWLWLIRVIGVFVPSRLRADWRQEWEAELRSRELLLADWDKLDWRNKLDLLRRSAGAFRDAMLLQPKRLEDEMFQDLRFGARMLLKQPLFTLVAVLSLALGIGGNTAIFSVVNALLLQSLPYPDSERIVLVWGHNRTEDNRRSRASFTDLADCRGFFEGVAAYMYWRPALSGDGEAERVSGMLISSEYFKVMQGRPLLGRVFTEKEDQPGNGLVVVLGHGLWQRRYGSDPDVVGRTIMLGGRNHTVIGVMPADFLSLPASLLGAPPAEFYRPLAEAYDNALRDARHLRAIARLRPNATLEQTQAEVDLLAAQIERAHPATNTGQGFSLAPLHKDLTAGVRPALWVLFGAIGCVLLIACANVANLSLARSAVRRKELAVRAALGAGRGRLMRLLLTESVLLACVGGAVGTLAAVWGVRLIERLGTQFLPLLDGATLRGIPINGRVLAGALSLSLLAGVLSGLIPSLRYSRPDLNEALKEGGRTGGAQSGRWLSALVVIETALALTLLVGAGLLTRSVLRLRNVDAGFNPRNVITMHVGLPRSKYREPQDWFRFFERLTDRVSALPGVEAAGATTALPLSVNFDRRAIEIADQPRPRGQELYVDLYVVTPDYLRAMKIPVLQGRGFNANDRAEAPPVALINEAMTQRVWPGQDPIGKRFRLAGNAPASILATGDSENAEAWLTVAGVVRDVRHYSLDATPPMQFYLPHAQMPASFMTLTVQTSGDAAGFGLPIRRELQALDKDQVPYDLLTMEQLMGRSIALHQLAMRLLAAFALVALAMAAIGIYGVMAYSVTQRTREIGLRVALGAQVGDVLKLVIGRGMRPPLLGIAIGLAASVALTWLLKGLLFEVSATDPLTFIGVALLLTAAALLAALVPARRAMRVDPMVALRDE
jgi:putative ABC transport system permease protein